MFWKNGKPVAALYERRLSSRNSIGSHTRGAATLSAVIDRRYKQDSLPLQREQMQ